jgi:hypothetical protein
MKTLPGLRHGGRGDVLDPIQRGKLQRLRAHLDDSLFPGASRAKLPLGRVELLAGGLALMALAIVLQLARLGWSTSTNSLWAEDGSVFLHGALTQSFWHAVSSPYSKYLVLVPRLIGEVAALVPLRDAPAAVSILSAAVVALSGLVVWHASATHVRSPYLRGTLTVLTVLVPVGGFESLDSAAYVSWYMLFATFWILFWRPRTLWGAALASLFVLATALSNPGVWFFIPLAILRAIAGRDRRDLMIVGSFVVGAVIQASVLAASHEQVVEPLWTHDIWTVYLQRIVDGGALGLRLGGIGWVQLGWPLLIVLTLCWVTGLALGLRRSSSTARYITAIAIPTSLLMFVVSTYQRAVAPEMLWPANAYDGNGARYAIVPALLLISAAVVLIDDVARRRFGPSRRSLAQIATVAVALLAIATSFWARNIAARGSPPWSAALDSAAATCAGKNVSEATLPISPPGFSTRLPCTEFPSAQRPGP